ncbi:MAG: bifunctional phosphoribosylaminoimidazolecarboxamide formyltransferase/IMP cyclohydrolase [Bradymonadaceae bacterium]
MSSQSTPYALLSVSDKRGIADFAGRLIELGFRIVSTGGTARHIRDAGHEVVDVASVTGYPEILDGRVKTLHPRIHGALLADRRNPGHRQVLQARDVPNIVLVVVNLYPFEEVVSRPDVDWDEAIENIDIGGPTMLRASAKNHESITVLVDPGDFDRVAATYEGDGEGPDTALRRELALKAFAHTAAYDAAIVEFFENRLRAGEDGGDDEALPERINLDLRRTQTLRYGENPHQEAALYTARGEAELGAMEQLHGKELSYNNIVDLDAALELVWEFDGPATSIIKHTNPAGCAEKDNLRDAYEAALKTDSQSAFGGIVALNRSVDAALARRMNEHFFEIIAAPEFDEEALEILMEKKNLRLIRWPVANSVPRSIRATSLGYLAQNTDPRITVDIDALEVPTKRAPSPLERDALVFAWKVCKHVKSNAIVFANGTRTLGVGAGQMSRVDSVELAVRKSVAGPTAGAVLASDAFFPFRDGIDAAAAAGIRAIIQPGGSRRDDEVVAACDEHDIAMYFAGQRHFRH